MDTKFCSLKNNIKVLKIILLSLFS